MKIIFSPNEAENDMVTGNGPTFAHCVHDLINALVFSYGEECLSSTAIFEGLALLSKGDETEFRHWDFSVPEEAFTMKVVDWFE